jgi:hypothetical protein
MDQSNGRGNLVGERVKERVNVFCGGTGAGFLSIIKRPENDWKNIYV